MPLNDAAIELDTLNFLSGGGEMGALIRAHDWSATSLGPPERWSQPLRTVVRLILNTRHPMYIFWGPELLCFYNDAFRPSIGSERHPGSLGQPARSVWSEIWPIVGPQIDQVMSGGGATWHENQLVPITRNGRLEDVYWTYSYGPIDDGSAPHGVGGVLVVVTETTDQVLAQRRLDAERGRQHQMLQQMPGFAAVLSGPDHRFLFVNDAYRDIAGDRDFVGKTAREAFPELADQGFLDLLDRVYATDEPFSARAMPISLDRPEGERFVDFLYEPLHDENGKVNGVFVGGYDVTEQVNLSKHREALLELDDRLRDVEDTGELSFAASELLGKALGAVRVGYGVLCPQALTIAVERNWSAPGFADVAGLHRFSDYGSYIDELLSGLPVANFDVDSDPRTSDKAASFRALNIRAHLDVPVVEDGRAVAQMFVHSATPRVWTPAEIAFVREFAERTRVAIARRLAEKELSESEARYRALFDSIDEGFCIIEFIDGPHGALSDYVHVEANPAYTTNAGIPDIVGKRLREIVSKEEADAWAQIYRGVLVNGKSIRFERELVETGRHLELAAFRVDSPEKRQVAVLFQDITARRDAEAKLRELNETLEARITERTAELESAHNQLRQAQKLESMGQLTGGVAHDFNNLLTPIVGALDMLQRQGVGGEREQRLISGAAQSAERARTLVQRLLAFARRQPLQPIAVDVGKLVQGMADLISSTTGPQIKVKVEVEDALPAATGDPNQLEMALLNLAVNARDAMPEGGILRVSASAEEVEPGEYVDLGAGGYVRLSVADTGVGMDEATARRAVEPFFSTKGVGKGTGLGLSMVHGLAAQLGGMLSINSKPGVGTNVELWLPQNDQRPPEQRPAVREAKATARRGTALLVDDEEFVRLSTADMLVDLGYRVLEAPSAEDALRLLRDNGKVDLLVTDHLMPGMTGTELARTVRESRPDLPVLVVSGYAEMDGVAPDLPRLTKPFLHSELAQAVARLVPTPAE